MYLFLCDYKLLQFLHKTVISLMLKIINYKESTACVKNKNF